MLLFTTTSVTTSSCAQLASGGCVERGWWHVVVGPPSACSWTQALPAWHRWVWGLGLTPCFLIPHACSPTLTKGILQELAASWQAYVLQGARWWVVCPAHWLPNLWHPWSTGPPCQLKGAHLSLQVHLASIYIHNLFMLGSVSVCICLCFSRASCLLWKCKYFTHKALEWFTLLLTKRCMLYFSRSLAKCINNFFL